MATTEQAIAVYISISLLGEPKHINIVVEVAPRTYEIIVLNPVDISI